MNQYQIEHLEKVNILSKELENVGYKSEIVTDENKIVLTLEVDGNKYSAERDYHGIVNIYEYLYQRLEGVSSHVYREVCDKHATNNIKVITGKAIARRIEAIEVIRKELNALQDKAKSAHATFLESIKDLNFTVYEDKKTGYMVKNGIKFSFELGDDGYISKKITLDYSVDATIENFISLSSNGYDAL